MLYEFEVGQQVFANSHQGAGGCGRLGTRVDLQLENPLIFHPYNQL